MSKVRIACLSDTHKRHKLFTNELQLGGFLAVHAGDADCLNKEDWEEFRDWLIMIAMSFQGGIIYVPGNHDPYVEANIEECKRQVEGKDVHILVNEKLDISGLKVWGGPFVPPTGEPNFSAFTGNGLILEPMWDDIPFGLDLLVTHGPASGVLDAWMGDPWLFEAIRRNRPKIHIFGHVHGQVGVIKREHTLHANVAIGMAERPVNLTWVTYDLFTGKAEAERAVAT